MLPRLWLAGEVVQAASVAGQMSPRWLLSQFGSELASMGGGRPVGGDLLGYEFGYEFQLVI